MEVFRFNILPDEEYSKREIFKMSLFNCQICGGELKFNYTQEQNGSLKEDAHCPCCHIQMKSQTHNLH